MRIGAEVIGVALVKNYIDSPLKFDRRRAFARAGLAVETSARRKAPVRTGHLRRNIVSVVHGGYSKNVADMYAEVGVDLNTVPYAWYQEFGTSKMQAHPYLRPALKSRAKAIDAIFKDEIAKAIKEGSK